MKIEWRSHQISQVLPFSLAFTFLVFGIYLKTLAPSVSGGDSGDLLTAICTSGVPHPPGYPLYVLLSKLFLPLTHLTQTTAWVINFSSAIYASLAALLILLTVTKLTQNKWSGLVAGGMFAFAPIVWRYAISSEVFALNNLLACTVLYLFVLYLENRNLKLAILTLFIFGLGLSNHHSLLFIGVPISVFLIWDQRPERGKTKKGATWKLGCAFLLGLTPYLYLPWAGSKNLTTSWGQTDTVVGFLSHILRSEYGTFRLSPAPPDHSSAGDLGQVLYDLILNQLIVVGNTLIGIGIWASLIKRKPHLWQTARIVSICCVLSSICYFSIFFILNPMPANAPLKLGVHLRFLQLLLIPLSILMGLGFSQLTFFRFQPLVAAILMGSQVLLHYQAEDQTGNYSSYRYAKAYLESLPHQAILLLWGDSAYYPISYLQSCEHYRSDVVVIARGLMRASWMSEHLKSQFSQVALPTAAPMATSFNNTRFDFKNFLDLNYDKHPLYISNYNPFEDNTWESFYTTWPTGFTNRILRRDHSKLNRKELLKESSRILDTFDFSDLATFPVESWENNYYRTYKETYSHLAMILALSATEDKTNAKFYLDWANTYFKEYFRNNPYPAPQAILQWKAIDQYIKTIL